MKKTDHKKVLRAVEEAVVNDILKELERIGKNFYI